MPEPLEQVVSVLAGAPERTLPVPSDELRFANPSHLMVAQLFLSMVTTEEIRRAIERAASLSDLKLLLMADEFFGRVAEPERRAEMSALLRSPDASIEESVTSLVRALAETTYHADVASGRVSELQALHSARGAAEALAVSQGRVLQAVSDGRVDAVVCLTDAGLSQLREDVRQRGRM